MGVYWWIEYWHYLLTILATYFLTQKIFRKKELSLFSAVASGLIYESSIVYSNLFLIPQTLAAVLGILLLGEIINNSDYTEIQIPIIRSIIKSVPVIISLATIFFLHFVIGLGQLSGGKGEGERNGFLVARVARGYIEVVGLALLQVDQGNLVVLA